MVAFPAPLVGPRLTLREVEARDVAMARELATDPYVPQGGTLPLDADDEQAAAWIERQRNRLAEGRGYSFAMDVAGVAVGQCGLWFAGPGRFTVGYAVAPSARGRAYAVDALVLMLDFAWTHPGTSRVDAHVEPWNVASLRTAERAGFARTGSTTHVIGGASRAVEVWSVRRPS